MASPQADSAAASPGTLHSADGRIRARYLLETPAEVAKVAATIAGEQSTGTFVRLPQENAALLERCAARVERVDVVAEYAPASLAVTGHIDPQRSVRQAVIELSWSMDNFGTCLPSLMATVAGNLFELRDVTGLRLQALSVPAAFTERYPGPAFGVAGTRALSGVANGPLIGTIIKPSVGLSPEQTAAQAAHLCEGGIDFIKDDELQADGAHCPFAARVAAVMAVVNRHADRSGRKVMVAFNISGDLDAMRRRHDLVLAHGGTCVMVSLNAVGLAGVEALCHHAQLPVHGHRNGWGYLSRHAALGFDYAAWQVFWRLAGVDHMHVNGLRNKFSESDESVMASARVLGAPLFDAGHPGYQAMPVFSSGQWADQAFDTFRGLGHADLIYTCGGGIVAHPDGIAAGVRSVRAAWDAAMAGSTAREAAAQCPELARALAFFGPRA